MPGSRSVSGKCLVTIGPFDFDVEYSCYSDPGNTSGPIERCYPPESEMNIQSVTYSGEDVADLLAESVLEQIEAKCWEDAQHAWDDEADAEYECWRANQELRCDI